jgi:hypothetical protein
LAKRTRPYEGDPKGLFDPELSELSQFNYLPAPEGVIGSNRNHILGDRLVFEVIGRQTVPKRLRAHKAIVATLRCGLVRQPGCGLRI